jgi:hypothetical protein
MQKREKFGRMTMSRRQAPAAPWRQRLQPLPQLRRLARTRSWPSNRGVNSEKLQSQLKGVDTQLDELKRFQAGDLSGDAGRRLHKRYSSAPIPEQIAKPEEKRNNLQDQIQAIYEEACKKGILPGQLR